eukprot:jgi/Botrbrau1/12189/Bobra.0186s0096.1
MILDQTSPSGLLPAWPGQRRPTGGRLLLSFYIFFIALVHTGAGQGDGQPATLPAISDQPVNVPSMSAPPSIALPVGPIGPPAPVGRGPTKPASGGPSSSGPRGGPSAASPAGAATGASSVQLFALDAQRAYLLLPERGRPARLVLEMGHPSWAYLAPPDYSQAGAQSQEAPPPLPLDLCSFYLRWPASVWSVDQAALLAPRFQLNGSWLGSPGACLVGSSGAGTSAVFVSQLSQPSQAGGNISWNSAVAPPALQASLRQAPLGLTVTSIWPGVAFLPSMNNSLQLLAATLLVEAVGVQIPDQMLEQPTTFMLKFQRRPSPALPPGR